ncbi:zinc finger protein 2-like [Mantella aurantiaca]
MARTLPAKMHVTFSDVAVYLSEEEWRSLNRWQLQLYMEVMNENYASLQSLGLPVPEADLLQCTEGQKWRKRPFRKAGELTYAPLHTDKASHGLGEMKSMTAGSTERELNGKNLRSSIRG